MSLGNSEDPFNIDWNDVTRSVEQDGRRAVRVPGFCVIVLDAQLIDLAYIRHFEDTPLGYLQAMKWAVRMEEADIQSEKTVAQLREEYEKELERSPLEHGEAVEQMNPLASLQAQVDALSSQLSQASRDLEMAMGRYDEATLSFRGMNKQERLALCKELGLYVKNKPVSGHHSEQQLYDALIRYKRRELNLSNLMTQKYDAGRALARANLALKTAIAQEELNHRGLPICLPEDVRVGAHVWAITDGDIYECIIQEKGQRHDSDRCALRFAHPQDVPPGILIGWRRYCEIRALE